jgi:predicted nucleic acid-binding protein
MVTSVGGGLTSRSSAGRLSCRAAGIQRMVKLTDALIAATGIEHGLAVVTQDDDYDRIAAVHAPLRVIKV